VNVDEMFWNWMSRLLDNAQHWQRFALYECHLVFVGYYVYFHSFTLIILLYLVYECRLCRSAWLGQLRPSVCLSVSLNKVLKLGEGMT